MDRKDCLKIGAERKNPVAAFPFASVGRGRLFLTGALVHVVRRSSDSTAIWLQVGALGFYLLDAVTAVASEGGALSANVHRPFSILTQLMIALSLYRFWGQGQRTLTRLNVVAWAAILADTALHFILVR